MFDHCNGDVFVWKYLWKDAAKDFGVEVPEPTFENAAGQADTLANEIDMAEWAKDKRPVWEAVVKKYGCKPEAFDFGTWGFFNWATGKSWCTISSTTKARKYGWQRTDNTFETWIETFRAYENSGLLPTRDSLLMNGN